MSDLQRAAEIERLMQLLMHDLRSPLGVAQGYVALLGGQELSPDDRVRALRGVTDAIARISKLVDDAATLMSPEETDERHGFVEASLLCERVAVHVAPRGIPLKCEDPCPGLKVRVGTSVDRLSESIAIVLCPAESARRAPAGPMTLSISNDNAELRFEISRDGSAAADPGELVTFDPEGIGTVEQLKAHHHISLLQGRVLRELGETRACRVTLPLSRSIP